MTSIQAYSYIFLQSSQAGGQAVGGQTAKTNGPLRPFFMRVPGRDFVRKQEKVLDLAGQIIAGPGHEKPGICCCLTSCDTVFDYFHAATSFRFHHEWIR